VLGETDCRSSDALEPSRSATELDSIRVLVVDDHLLVRCGLVAVLSRTKRCEVVAQAGTGAEAVRQFVKHRPDVTLLDRWLPDTVGEQVLARLRQEDPAARVIMLSADEGEDDAYRALRAGASGYLCKSVSGAELLIAIEAVRDGGTYVAEMLRDRLEQRQRRVELSLRELEILRRIVAGYANKEIAVALSLAMDTVKFHVSRILRKLEVEDRAQATAIAIARGLVHVRDDRSEPSARAVASA
jgi:DNA-binding NarL/FixJ family response regulator